MLLFGHVGFTMSFVKIYESIIQRKNCSKRSFIDYRVVAIGAMLPDIIDKPLVQMLYGLGRHDGHFIAHYPLFAELIILIGMIVYYRKKNNNILVLGVCTRIHQLLDDISRYETSNITNYTFTHNNIITRIFNHIDMLIAPIYKNHQYLKDLWLFSMDPFVFTTEFIGFVCILYFLYRYIIKGKI